MEAKYIIDAIAALEQCELALMNFAITPEERGHLSVKAWMAAKALRIYSGIQEVQVPIEQELSA